MARKYTKEILEPVVSESYSILEVLKKLGIKTSGLHIFRLCRKRIILAIKIAITRYIVVW